MSEVGAGEIETVTAVGARWQPGSELASGTEVRSAEAAFEATKFHVKH